MQWPIRRQILVPLLAVQGLAVVGTTAATAGLAARLGERQIEARLRGVLDTLAQSNFPATNAVLARMHGLSGAHFLALDPDDRPAAASRPGLAREVDRLAPLAPLAFRLDSLRSLPTVHVAGADFRIARSERVTASPTASAMLVLYPETDLRRARWEAALPVLAMGAVALLLLGAWTSWTADRISRRLRRVQRVVARIADGEPDPVDVGGPRDEVRDLADTVERMGRDLRLLHDRIRHSERERVLAQIAAGLAHQLRNALTGARISLQLHTRRSPVCASEPALGVALQQLALTEEQIRGLLAIGRAPSHLSPSPEAPSTCDPAAIAREAAALLAPAADHAHARLSVDGPPEATTVVCAPAGLRAALLNLLQNAIEAAGPGGRIDLHVLPGGLIEVLDDGPGPPESLADRLFEPFATSKPEGVGLGLALARRMVEDASGRLSWERRGDRTCFRIELPSAAVEPAPRGIS